MDYIRIVGEGLLGKRPVDQGPDAIWTKLKHVCVSCINKQTACPANFRRITGQQWLYNVNPLFFDPLIDAAPTRLISLL